MTKVEELRKELNADLGACHLALFRDDKGVTESIDSLIAAAKEEGAEQMREKIVAESYPCRLSEKSHCWIFRIDDPTLSPAPKEKP
jgi:hypothetical protein